MRGALAAQAAHIPVHLGSTPLAVRAVLERVTMGPGDVVIVNDPFAGGTHLPDVTLVAPVFLPRARRPFAYVANRAHHADMGGMSPGSMPLATEFFQVGFRLPPVRPVSAGLVDADVLALFLADTRVPAEHVGVLLVHRALRGARAAERRPRAAAHHRRPGGLDRQRALPGRGGGRQRRDLAAHRRRALARPGARRARSRPGRERRLDEQPGPRWRG